MDKTSCVGNVWVHMWIYITIVSAASTECDPEIYFNDNEFLALPPPDCEAQIGAKFLLYTRQNPTEGVYLNRTYIPSLYGWERSHTLYLVHGYKGDVHSHWMSQVKDAVLDKADVNVVLMGWGRGADHIWYPTAAANTRVAGAVLAEQAARLGDAPHAPRAWCVGHSLGAHVCGFAGKRRRWSRLSGLDPAGPLFNTEDGAERLNQTDADFVDVIHTDGGMFGLMAPVGHVDFYPNGGRHQPGCPALGRRRRRAALYARGGNSCSHGRSWTFFMSSIKNQDCFPVTQICADPYDIPDSCVPCGAVCQHMGARASRAVPGVFYLSTAPQSPYC